MQADKKTATLFMLPGIGMRTQQIGLWELRAHHPHPNFRVCSPVFDKIWLAWIIKQEMKEGTLFT
jgi:hypothetical protein